mgnify:CR=1 FL=1
MTRLSPGSLKGLRSNLRKEYAGMPDSHLESVLHEAARRSPDDKVARDSPGPCLYRFRVVSSLPAPGKILLDIPAFPPSLTQQWRAAAGSAARVDVWMLRFPKHLARERRLVGSAGLALAAAPRSGAPPSPDQRRPTETTGLRCDET